MNKVLTRSEKDVYTQDLQLYQKKYTERKTLPVESKREDDKHFVVVPFQQFGKL